MLGWGLLQLFECSGNDTADDGQAEWAAMLEGVLSGMPIAVVRSIIKVDQIHG